MPTYEVDLMKTLWTTVTVEADSEDDALDQAFNTEEMPGGMCAYCSGVCQAWSVDEDEWDIPPVEFKKNPVRLVEVESNRDDASDPEMRSDD